MFDQDSEAIVGIDSPKLDSCLMKKTSHGLSFNQKCHCVSGKSKDPCECFLLQDILYVYILNKETE